MVLVDTSVWIRSLSGRPGFVAELDRLLADNDVAGHELVYGELLIGDTGGRKNLLRTYEQFYRAGMIPHYEVVDFVHRRGLHARGVGWINIHLLASALVSRMKLWTADPRFAAVAEEIGIAYRTAA